MVNDPVAPASSSSSSVVTSTLPTRTSQEAIPVNQGTRGQPQPQPQPPELGTQCSQMKATTKMHMDDLVYRATTWEQVEAADTVVRQFSADWGVAISPKTHAFSVSRAGRMITRRLEYQTTCELQWLGTFHHFPFSQRQRAEAAFGKKLQIAQQRLHRVAWLKVPWELRQHYIASNALAGLTWAPLGQPHPVSQLRGLDSQVFHVMKGGNPKALQKMAKKIFWCILVKGHRLSTLVARTISTIVALRHASPEQQTRLLEARRRVAMTGQKLQQGLITTMQSMLTSIGLELTEELRLKGIHDGEHVLPLMAPIPPSDFLHQFRQLWRRAQFTNLQARRPHFAGATYDELNLKTLRRWIAALDKQKAHLELQRDS